MPALLSEAGGLGESAFALPRMQRLVAATRGLVIPLLCLAVLARGLVIPPLRLAVVARGLVIPSLRLVTVGPLPGLGMPSR
jgi:hypothetical protein